MSLRVRERIKSGEEQTRTFKPVAAVATETQTSPMTSTSSAGWRWAMASFNSSRPEGRGRTMRPQRPLNQRRTRPANANTRFPSFSPTATAAPHSHSSYSHSSGDFFALKFFCVCVCPSCLWRVGDEAVTVVTTRWTVFVTRLPSETICLPPLHHSPSHARQVSHRGLSSPWLPWIFIDSPWREADSEGDFLPGFVEEYSGRSGWYSFFREYQTSHHHRCTWNTRGST